MKLDLVKGFETSLIIDNVDDSINENGFLAESYKKAGDVLKAYASQTDKIREELIKDRSIAGMNDCLYRSPQNVIAFSGKRGTGKTSTMLSFSQSLAAEKSNLRKEALQNRDVLVLDPIDPTMLENDQNILNVVLSRLLYKAEEVWKESMDYNRRYQDKEKEKNEILSLAKKCLSGITAIKSRSSMDTLADLQRIGDSAILKRDFYELVEILNRFALASGISVSNHPLLVLQIDDTDCQISKGYQVMEDIRKYLTIPNVVILMAIDIDMMRLVLTQHYMDEFNSGLKEEIINKAEIRRYADKYMAKLLPPAHKIYLPVVDEVIRDQADTIELGYYEAEDVDKKNNILKKGKSFQSKVLNFIYQKTHLVFAAHDAYLNNIIPTTLRGLTYFLNVLGSMEDVPEVDITKAGNMPSFIDEWNKQLSVIEKNLDIFEDYFMNDWIQAKLSHEMIGIMEKVASRVPEERIRYAYNEIWKYYNENPQRDKTGVYNREQNPTYYDLDCLLQQILGTTYNTRSGELNSFRELDDFYNVFSIRTLLSIKNNKDIIKIKRQAVGNADSTLENKVVLDYYKSKNSLPNSLYLDDKRLGEYKIVFGGDKKIYNFTDDIIVCLSKEALGFLGAEVKQQLIRQEIALLIASNFELQEVIRKTVKNMPLKGECETFAEVVEYAFREIQESISSINDDMLKSCTEYIKKDEKRFTTLNLQKETQRQEKVKLGVQKQTQKFEDIKALFDIINKYPSTNAKNLIEEMHDNISRMIKKVEEYLEEYLAEKADKFKDISKKLSDYKVILDDRGIPGNREEFDALMREVKEFLDEIEPKKRGNNIIGINKNVH